MKSIKMALLGGAALAVTAAGAQADDLEALKAQINELNARMAAMEATPAIPAGYQLLTVSEGELKDIPGLEMSAGERRRAGSKATVISVMPTADAPVGTVITWNGRINTGLVYRDDDVDISLKFGSADDALDAPWGPSFGKTDFWTAEDGEDSDRVVVKRKGLIAALGLSPDGDTTLESDGDSEDIPFSEDGEYSGDAGSGDDLDVKAQSRLRVTATTDTAVGEVGVTMEMRADMDGRTDYDVYMNEAWGYWSMTPELTFGGGYTGSLADIGYGYDGACSCYWTDNADMAFNPGDTTQMRLSYASGPFSMAVALEDSSDEYALVGGGNDSGYDNGGENGDRLGVAGQLKYSGDTFSGEVSGGWWDVDEEDFYDVDNQWQVGAGLGFALGEMFNFSVGAAMGEGPTTVADSQSGVSGESLPVNNQWWGVSALASAGLTDGIHAEIAGGYKKREGDNFSFLANEWDSADDVGLDDRTSAWDMDGVEYETWAVMGGLYYTPVDQLTIGIEGEWYTTETSWSGKQSANGCDTDGTNCDTEENYDEDTVDLDIESTTFVASFAAVWRF